MVQSMRLCSKCAAAYNEQQGWEDGQMKGTIFLVALNAVWLAVSLLAPILRAQRQETGMIIQSWKYDPETKGLALKLVNSSGKDIIAYNISDSDGSRDYYGRPNPPGEHLEDALGSLIIAQMSGKEPDKDKPNGIFASGATRTLILWAKDISVKAVVDLVVYADATAEVLNEHAFSQVVAIRTGQLMAMQKVSETTHRALEDATITNPGAAAVEKLKRELVEAKKLNNPEVAEGNRAVGLQSAIADLERYQQPNFFSKKGTERDHLKEYVEDLDKRIALILPHTQIRVLESK